MSRVGGIERPGELRPGPPQHPEDEHRFARPHPGEVVVEEAYELGDPEDENEIEEELTKSISGR